MRPSLTWNTRILLSFPFFVDFPRFPRACASTMPLPGGAGAAAAAVVVDAASAEADDEDKPSSLTASDEDAPDSFQFLQKFASPGISLVSSSLVVGVAVAPSSPSCSRSVDTADVLRSFTDAVVGDDNADTADKTLLVLLEDADPRRPYVPVEIRDSVMTPCS